MFERVLNTLLSFTVKSIAPTIKTIIFSDLLIFYHIFLSPQVKQSVIISNKHDIYKLPKDIGLRILGN